MGASLASASGRPSASSPQLADFARDVRVRTEFLQNVGEIFVLVLPVKPLNRLLDFRRVGHDDLHFALAGESISSAQRRVKRLGQRDLHRAIVHRDGHAMIHPRDVGGNRLDESGVKFTVAQLDDFRAQMRPSTCRMSSILMMPKSCKNLR